MRIESFVCLLFCVALLVALFSAAMLANEQLADLVPTVGRNSSSY